MYISEAHATDEWPVPSSRYTADGKDVLLQQTSNTVERAERALRVSSELGYTAAAGWQLLTAPCEAEIPSSALQDSFEAVYKPWPLRIYAFSGSTLQLNMEPHGCELRLQELTGWLSSHL